MINIKKVKYRTLIFLHLFILYISCSISSVSKYSKLESSCDASDSTTVFLHNRDSINRAIGGSPKFEIMIDAGVGGTVFLNIHVSGDSTYLGHDVLRSPHPISTEAVTDFIPYMRFGIKKGENFSPHNRYLLPYKFKYTTRN